LQQQRPQQALVGNATLRAPVWLAHTQLEYARLLGPGDPAASTLIDAAELAAQQLDLPAVARSAVVVRGP